MSTPTTTSYIMCTCLRTLQSEPFRHGYVLLEHAIDKKGIAIGAPASLYTSTVIFRNTGPADSTDNQVALTRSSSNLSSWMDYWPVYALYFLLPELSTNPVIHKSM
eukprot:Blabericola_migrator_1__6069@NODE_3062_length_2069_cov_76_395604_g1914_i0_p2_GENE_NODE_3062_length_2069_cov_76_395604_g1914_i0NODE_3062_length_2069_cov_76_395604_g1914_i0_p2_ORF_typecomplete_len106_score3_60_NODE_3062_length_2069_cov_76_395604_g1914_i017312048